MRRNNGRRSRHTYARQVLPMLAFFGAFLGVCLLHGILTPRGVLAAGLTAAGGCAFVIALFLTLDSVDQKLRRANATRGVAIDSPQVRSPEVPAPTADSGTTLHTSLNSWEYLPLPYPLLRLIGRMAALLCPPLRAIPNPYWQLRIWRLASGGFHFVGSAIQIMPVIALVIVAQWLTGGLDGRGSLLTASLTIQALIVVAGLRLTSALLLRRHITARARSLIDVASPPTAQSR